MANELDDDRLEAELRQLAERRDPVPPELLAAASDAFGWRDVDAELADLVYDSLLDDDAATLVRGAADQRLFSFRVGEVTIDLEVTSAGGQRSVLGQIVPPRPGRVEVRRHGSVVAVTADELGRFGPQPLAPGPVSLRLHPGEGSDGPPIVTDWVTI